MIYTKSSLFPDKFFQLFLQFQKISNSAKIALLSLSLGGLTLLISSKFFRRNRKYLEPHKNSLKALRKIRTSSQSQSIAESQQFYDRKIYNWAELQKQGGTYFSDKDSVTSLNTLLDGTPLSPQQLGLMGMEALETVISYWEDALDSYSSSVALLRDSEENQFIVELENIMETVYQLQEKGERLFIYEHSYFNKKKRVESLIHVSHKSEITSIPNTFTSSCVDGDIDSFISAQDTIADLNDFNDINDIFCENDSQQTLFVDALKHLEEFGIPYRGLRTELVGLDSDSEYLCKVHCLRLCFKHLMGQEESRAWWINSGRMLLSELIIKAQKDPKDFIHAYDDLIEYLSIDENIKTMGEELKSRNVKCMNFFDIVIDYILIDSFQDLECPPSSVLAVMKNRWLSNSFKESALHTAIWSVLKTKRRLLIVPHGFKAQFYNLSEILTPILAWSFFGPNEQLNATMKYFKDQTFVFIKNIFSFQYVRYISVESVAKDVSLLAKQYIDLLLQVLKEES